MGSLLRAHPREAFLLLPTALLQAVVLLTTQLFGGDWLAAAGERLGVVRRSSGALLCVLTLAPFRATVLKPNLEIKISVTFKKSICYRHFLENNYIDIFVTYYSEKPSDLLYAFKHNIIKNLFI